VRYLHGDRMGSVDMVSDEHGVVLERHGYDAFGKPLTSDWEDSGGLLHDGEHAAATTTRGFSAHEHLDAHGLIHMNGRAYDPALGRFLSVDPIIQNPLSSQSLNAYSYVLNNPLSGVDPTGYECNPVDTDTAGCVDSDGNVISQPATAEPGQNGQEGQGVDAAERGPAADQGRPGRPVKDCGGGSCVTLPNTVKRQVIDGVSHFDFDFDWTGSAPPDDGKTSLGTGTGSGPSVRVTLDQAKALDGARIVGTALSGAAGAVKAALGRLFRGVASRASGALSSALGRFTGKLGALSRAEQAAGGRTGFKGSKGFQLKNAPYQKVRNQAKDIGGRRYSGHALDQMQNRGVMPSVVDNTIKHGSTFPAKAGTVGYYDPVNNIRVITNAENGTIVTVIRGAP
jgi:RHS repeat-associated protein